MKKRQVAKTMERATAEYLEIDRVADKAYKEGFGTDHGASIADCEGNRCGVDLSIECKYKTVPSYTTIREALDQSKEYARTAIPMAVVKKKGQALKDSIISMRMKDFKRFLDEIEEHYEVQAAHRITETIE